MQAYSLWENLHPLRIAIHFTLCILCWSVNIHCACNSTGFFQIFTVTVVSYDKGLVRHNHVKLYSSHQLDRKKCAVPYTIHGSYRIPTIDQHSCFSSLQQGAMYHFACMVYSSWVYQHPLCMHTFLYKSCLVRHNNYYSVSVK